MVGTGGGGAHPRRLGHSGVLGVLVATPLAALSLVGLGRTLGPHPPPPALIAPATGTTPARQAADQCYERPPAGTPTRLPRGYRYLWSLSSTLGDHGQQATWVYNRDCSDPDAAFPVLVIRVTSPDVPLTAGGKGRSVELHSSQATALYYQRWLPPDLHMLLCRGSYWYPDATVACRWDTPTINLLLVKAGEATYAIVGGRSNGIGMNELVAIAHRLPGAHPTD